MGGNPPPPPPPPPVFRNLLKFRQMGWDIRAFGGRKKFYNQKNNDKLVFVSLILKFDLTQNLISAHSFRKEGDKKGGGLSILMRENKGKKIENLEARHIMMFSM